MKEGLSQIENLKIHRVQPVIPADDLLKNYAKKKKYELVVAITIIYILNFICFFVAWIVGSIEMKTRYFEVLSYLIANDLNAQIIYLTWFGIYVTLNLLLIYACLRNDISVVNNANEVIYNETVYCSYKVKHKVYILTTMTYIPVNVLRLFAFFLLYNYNLNHFKNEHYIWTAIAMIGSIACSVLLFARRLSSRVYILLHKYAYVIFALNALFIILQIVFISLLPAASDSLRGTFELLLAIFIGLDPLFQISDLYNDYNCYTTISMHATYLKLRKTAHKILSRNELVNDDDTLYTITTTMKTERVLDKNI